MPLYILTPFNGYATLTMQLTPTYRVRPTT